MSKSTACIAIFIAFLTLSAQAIDRSQFITQHPSSVLDHTESTGVNNALGESIFGVIRLYWNGLDNGYNDWNKDYVIDDWCMDTEFQKEFFQGIFIGFFKAITLQYINLFQLSSDILNAYNFITKELDYCKGSDISDMAHFFFFDTMIWFEIAATFIAIIENLQYFLASIPLGFFSLFSGDIKNVGYIHGTLVKLIFTAAKNL